MAVKRIGFSSFWRLQALILSSIFAIFPQKVSAQTIEYRVSEAHLDCLKSNYENYLKQEKNLLIIALELCPEIPDDPLAAITINANPKLPKTVKDKHDRLIVLTKKELKCLAQKTFETGGSDYIILPTTCEVKVKK